MPRRHTRAHSMAKSARATRRPKTHWLTSSGLPSLPRRRRSSRTWSSRCRARVVRYSMTPPDRLSIRCAAGRAYVPMRRPIRASGRCSPTVREQPADQSLRHHLPKSDFACGRHRGVRPRARSRHRSRAAGRHRHEGGDAGDAAGTSGAAGRGISRQGGQGGRDLDRVIDLELLGGIVAKAVTAEPRQGHPALRLAEFRGGMLNAVGLANPGVEHVATDELPWLAGRLRRARVLVNVAGASVADYVRVIERLTSQLVITAFEINASCPNTSAGGLEFGSDPGGLAELVRACRRVSTKPLTVKLSPVLPDIPGMAKVARDEGAEAVSLVNTMPGLLDKRLGHGNGGLSGPALLPIGVLATRRVRERLGMPVIGVGGARTTADAREYLSAGASLVAIGTAALADPRLPARIARELS